MLTDTERGMIEDLFAKLRRVEAQGGPRDPEAEAFIGQLLSRNPGAAYYMAQTILMQEQALNQAQDRMQQLEQQARQPQQGGFLASLFGGGRPAQPPAPAYRQPQPQAQPGYGAQPGFGGQQAYNGRMPMAGGGGGGFLAGAAQTAMGVAGGMLLANAVGSMFAGGAEEAVTGAVDEATADLANFEEDLGGGFEEDPFA